MIGNGGGYARRLHLESIVAAATAWDDSGRAYDTGILCGRAGGRLLCRGRLKVGRDIVRDEIRWLCPRCGDRATIVEWTEGDGDVRRIWPLPPWAVDIVPGMADEYVRLVVGPRELHVLQRIASWEDELRNVVCGARRRGRKFLVVGPDCFCGDLVEALRGLAKSDSLHAACAARLRRRLTQARRASRVRSASCPDRVKDRLFELGEGPFAN